MTDLFIQKAYKKIIYILNFDLNNEKNDKKYEKGIAMDESVCYNSFV